MEAKTTQNRSNFVFKAGVALLIIAGVLWLSLVVIPFLPLSVGVKTGLAAFAIVIGEAAFWLGALGTGSEFVRRFRARFNKSKNQERSED